MTSAGEFTLHDCLFSAGRIPADFRLVRRIYRKRGFGAAVRLVASIASVYGRQALLKTALRPAPTFAFSGHEYRYFRHWRVTTFLNERAIELPIVAGEFSRRRPARVLEVGNVLSQYLRFPHVIVDKYEVSQGVLNVDAVDFDVPERFDLITSISTLEHIGWDEKPRDPDKTIRTLLNLQRLLAPGGRLICTFPLGYNPHLDEHIAAGRLPFSELRFLKRLNARNEWRQADYVEVAGARYGSPFVHANAVAVGVFEQDARTITAA